MTPQQLKHRLESYAEKTGISYWRISHRLEPNPFIYKGKTKPIIGRKNLYDASRGVPISDGLTAQLILFFQELDKIHV